MYVQDERLSGREEGQKLGEEVTETLETAVGDGEGERWMALEGSFVAASESGKRRHPG